MTFDQIKSAFKRATHFGMPFDGPFSVVSKTGLAVAARNYCMLIDAGPEKKEAGDFTDDLVFLHKWARAINNYCDSNRIDGDQDAKAAMACFRSRLFINPLPL